MLPAGSHGQCERSTNGRWTFLHYDGLPADLPADCVGEEGGSKLPLRLGSVHTVERAARKRIVCAAHAVYKGVRMLNVIGLRVRNLRSLRDTGWIEIRPITILVGKNSSGKSTLARVFPLLKQSAERRKQAPLLWFGRLVDFGSFSEAVSTFANPAEIEVSLRIESDIALTLSRRAFVNRQQVELPRAPGIDVVLSLTEGSDGRTQVKGLSLDVYGVRVVASNPGTQDESLQVNGRAVLLPPDGRLIWGQGEILPLMRLYGREVESGTVSDEEFSAPRRRLSRLLKYHPPRSSAWHVWLLS
jgi:hypothetical protein